MIAERDNPERRKIELAGIWARATVATLLLAAAGVMTAYALNTNALDPNVSIHRLVPSELAIVGDPPAPPLLDDERSYAEPPHTGRTDSAVTNIGASRRDPSAASAGR